MPSTDTPVPPPSPIPDPEPAPPAKARRKMRRRTKWIIAVGIVLILVLSGVMAVSWVAGQSLLHPKRDTNTSTPSALNLTWQWANFTTADDVPIVGWWIPADNATGTVIFLHGYSDAKAQGLPMFPFLHNASVNVMAFDFRAHGQSGGAYTTAGLLETREVDAAILWVENRTHRDERNIVLLGWSMGGAAAINAAAHYPDLGGVIADASFSRLHNIVDTSIGKFTGLPRWPFGPLAVKFASMSIGIDINDNAPVEAIASFHGPLLLIQGLADTTVVPSNVDEIAAAAPQAVVWKVPGAGHTECYKTDPHGYELHVVAFLAAHLSNPPPS